MSTLAQLTPRVLEFCPAMSSADESLRQALQEYSVAFPVHALAVLTCVDGLDQSLVSLAGLHTVTGAQWPYDSADHGYQMNDVAGFTLHPVNGVLRLLLATIDRAYPVAGDELLVFYTKGHTIEDLDSATVTTVFPLHEALITRGAGGFLCGLRAAALAESIAPNRAAVETYRRLSASLLAEFRSSLAELRLVGAPLEVPAMGSGWVLDKWETECDL